MLQLANCGLKKQGAGALAKAIESHKTLTVLNLSNNQLEDEGAILLAQAMLINSTIIK